jgi:hypothetical protein
VSLPINYTFLLLPFFAPKNIAVLRFPCKYACAASYYITHGMPCAGQACLGLGVNPSCKLSNHTLSFPMMQLQDTWFHPRSCLAALGCTTQSATSPRACAQVVRDSLDAPAWTQSIASTFRGITLCEFRRRYRHHGAPRCNEMA